MNAKIIPFGKYKGQPVDVLAADPQYRDWLSAQPWFREKFGDLHLTLVKVAAPSDDVPTPEHNAFQARFADPAFLARFHGLTQVWYESGGWDVVLTWRAPYRWTDAETGELGVSSREYSCGVELKPTIGDEYPAIVRTVRERRCKTKEDYIIVGYLAWTAEQPIETVRAMFPDIRWVDFGP